MRFEFSALPWELLGPRPAMITLTYPGDWQLYVPNSEILGRHRERFKERWRKKFGGPIGVWVVEFQRRGAPHLHMYMGLPDEVSDADYAALQLRTVKRKQREQVIGPYEARRRTPPVSGEFGEWLRTAWWESVESGLPAHHKRGVDVAVAFFSEEAASTTNRVKVADYFWRESGKWAQKNPPEDFGSLKFYGRWGGGKLGFNPVVSVEHLDERAGLELRRVLRRLMLSKQRRQPWRTARRAPAPRSRSRGRDGLTVFDVHDAPQVAASLVEWAEQAALDKAGLHDTAGPIPWRSGPVWRAASELVAVEPEPDEAEEAWEREQRDAEWDPREEADVALARELEFDAWIGAGINAARWRWERINAVRIANGQPPLPRPKRWRIVPTKPPGWVR